MNPLCRACGVGPQARYAQPEKVRLDRAADAAHAEMFEGVLPSEGIERELWRNVARAVLSAPGQPAAPENATESDDDGGNEG